jgi:hypothetical protein
MYIGVRVHERVDPAYQHTGGGMSAPVLSLVEHGWHSARMLSITCAETAACAVVHYIKGYVSRDVLGMITPYTGISIHPVRRMWFRIVTGCYVWWSTLTRSTRCIIVDNERTYRWVSSITAPWHTPVIIAHEHQQQLSYEYGTHMYGAADIIQQVIAPAVR